MPEITNHNPRSLWKEMFWVTAAFLAMGMVFFWREIGDGRILISGEALRAFFPWRAFATGSERFQSFDQILEFYPWKTFARTQFLQGVIPLWNPYNFCGSPFIGNIQSQMFYLPDLPFLLFCFRQSFLISGLMKIVVAGTGTYFLAREFALSRPAAFLSGTLYAFSGFFVIWLGYPQTTVAAWLPLVLLFTEHCISRQGKRGGPALATVIALQCLAGHPEVSFYLLLYTGVYFVIRMVQSRRRTPKVSRQIFIRFTLMLIIGVMAAMVIYLPFLEYFTESAAFQVRSGKSMEYAALKPICLIGFILPETFGSPAAGGFRLSAIDPGAGHLTYGEVASHFIGIWAIFFLICACVFMVQHPRIRIQLYTAVFAILILFGVPGVSWIMDNVPLLNLGFHLRTVFLLNLSMAILAGAGLHAVLTYKKRNISLISGLVLFTGGILLVSHFFFSQFESVLQSVELSDPWIMNLRFMWCVLGLGFVLLLSAMISGKRQLVLGMIPLMFLELFMFGSGYNPSVKPESLLPPVAVAGIQDQDPTLFRVTGMGPALFPNGNIFYGLYDCRGYDSLTPNRMYRLLEQFDPGLTQLRQSNNPLYVLISKMPENMLKLMNIRYICLPPGTNPSHFSQGISPDNEIFSQVKWNQTSPMPVWRYATPNPRFQMLYDIKIIPDEERALARLSAPDFNPGSQAIVSGTLNQVSVLDDFQGDGTVEVVRYAPGQIDLKFHTEFPGILVSSELWFPGWKAFRNGETAEIIQTNYTFMGMTVPAGSHEVSFRYLPTSFRLGLFLTLLAMLLLVALRRW